MKEFVVHTLEASPFPIKRLEKKFSLPKKWYPPITMKQADLPYLGKIVYKNISRSLQ